MSVIIDNLELASYIVKLADSKKASDILVLDFQGISILYDVFVIASAMTRVQTRAIARAIDEKLKALHTPKRRIQGMAAGTWILMDYGPVVAHIFTEPERAFYDLEELWKDVPRIDVESLRAMELSMEPEEEAGQQ